MNSHYKKSMKGVNRTTRLLVTEQIGYGVAGKIASSVDTATGNTIASQAFGTGAILAGIPSLMSGAGNVMGSLDVLYKKKKR